MTQTIIIDPVTRIEGHSKITIQLGDDGVVDTARIHITQYRGFEKLCEDRPFQEMPSLMERICGICTISHALASAKACDAIMAVRVPKTAIKLREMVNFGSLIQSHALSFYYLASPDFILGMESDPVKRSIFGLMQSHPQAAKDGIGLRRFGQQVIEWLAGKRLHPSWIVPGGVASPMTEEARDKIAAGLPEAYAALERTLEWYKVGVSDYEDEIAAFANFPTMHMSVVDRRGNMDLYDGDIRLVDQNGEIVIDIAPDEYRGSIGEAVEPWTFLKFPYYKPMGYPEGIYRVGSLSRLVATKKMGTPKADAELAEFREMYGPTPSSSFHNHHARLIECIYSLEKIEELINDKVILDENVRAFAGVNEREGVGVTEAPRGTLIHHYQVDQHGGVRWANLVIATAHNNLAMNGGVQQAAEKFVTGNKLNDAALNRVEAVIRTFDPCLSCSTHAQGQLALQYQLVAKDGTLLDEVLRS